MSKDEIIEALAKSVKFVQTTDCSLRLALHWDEEGRPYILRATGTKAYLTGTEVRYEELNFTVEGDES